MSEDFCRDCRLRAMKGAWKDNDKNNVNVDEGRKKRKERIVATHPKVP